MAQVKNLNVAPYFDDFDERDNFHKVLFRPGFAIQARELTTLQSILQNQIERFGSNNLILRSQSSNNRGVSMGNNSVNSLTLKDMEALKNELPAIAAIAPRVSLSTQIIANGNNWLATVTGSTNDYFELGNLSN